MSHVAEGAHMNVQLSMVQSSATVKLDLNYSCPTGLNVLV